VTLFLLIPALIYVAICAAAFLLQASLLFPVSQVGAAGPPPPGATRVALRAASGERLAGLHIPPGPGEGPPPLLLGFGGNAWNADAMAAYLHELYPEAEILAFHYRGYPPSEGSRAPPRSATTRSSFSTGRPGNFPAGARLPSASASAAASPPSWLPGVRSTARSW
jgi:hypothetical protein